MGENRKVIATYRDRARVGKRADSVDHWTISVCAYGDNRTGIVSERKGTRLPMVHICGWNGPNGSSDGELASLSFDPASVVGLCEALKEAAAKALTEENADYDFEVVLQRTKAGE